MAVGDTLAFLITGNGTPAIAEFDKVKAAAKKTAAEIDATMSQAGGGAGAGGGALGGLGISAGLAVAGVAVATGAVAKFGEAAVHSYLNAAEATLKYQRVAGGSAQDASRQVVVFKELGVNSDQAATAMYRLGRQTEAGGKALKDVGVGIATGKDGAVDLSQTLVNVADAYQHAGSAADRDAIVFAAFGRQGQAMIPILARDRTELAAMFAAVPHGDIFSEADLRKAEEIRIRSKEISEEWKGFENEIGKHVGGWFSDFEAGVIKVAGGLGLVNTKQLEIAASAQIAAQAAQNAAQQEANDAQVVADKMSKMQTAMDNAVDATIALNDATQAVADARKKLADDSAGGATDVYAAKARDVAAAEQQVTAALHSQSEARKALAEAEAEAAEKPARDALAKRAAAFAVVDAIKAQKIAIAEYGRNSEEAAKAADAVTAAQLDQQDTIRKANGPDENLARAKDALAAATQGVADAQHNVNVAQAEDPSAQLAADQRALTGAYENEAKAQDRFDKATSSSKISVGELHTAFDFLIGELKAAGADPATLKLFDDLRTKALAAAGAVGQIQTSEQMITTFPNPWSEPIGPHLVMPPAGSMGPPTVEGGTFPQTSSMIKDFSGTQINVNVQTNASPQDIAQAIAWSQTTRGRFS